MKLVYRQMLSFFLVICTLMVILTATYIQVTNTTLYHQTWDQLTTDSDTLMMDAVQYDFSNQELKGLKMQTLNANAQLLSRQNVHFTIYTPAKKVSFSSNGFRPSLTKDDWATVKRGKTIHKRLDAAPFRHDNSSRQMTEVIRPYIYQNKLIAVVATGTFVSTINQNRQQILINMLKCIALAAAVTLVMSYILSRQMTKRIKKMQKAATQIARGDYDIHLQTPSSDELDDLGRDFNKMADSLQASQEEIARQQERQQKFMADAAHEMRTPLTTINGLLEGLAYDAIPEEDKKHSIQLMQADTQRLIRLVNNTLDSEKLRTNQLTLRRTIFNGTEELHNLADQLKEKAAASGDVIKVDAPKLVRVYADYDRFVQIMFNIIQNAIQFTDQGTVTLAASREPHGATFSVTDTGIGMTKEQVDHIWDRFYKADRSRMNTQYGESGIGLSIVKQLVDLHGGKITVDSKHGVGSQFTIYFPDRDYAPANNGTKSQD
ncbi:HAMP domain-containing sensor histidine kinase [uncultured Limosilactobacillus sp.]|uniref:sensor histidine kinase n=1 Tax=uncultured Limosilactobacillus sp. TaxID=2837629 RepID=UPI0025D1D535|nr:HAMP domain-containing sensor histidine kinase [uncultured Limosilactobacillus sp.]